MTIPTARAQKHFPPETGSKKISPGPAACYACLHAVGLPLTLPECADGCAVMPFGSTCTALSSFQSPAAFPGVAKNCRSRGHNYWSITCRGPIRSITFLWQPVHANVLPCKWYIYFALLERAYAARTRIYAKLVSKGPPNLWRGPHLATPDFLEI